MASGTVAPTTPQPAEHVRRWRYEQLCRAGYSDAEAAELSERLDVDLHEAIDLVRHGCPPAVAVEILR
jgi:hypothetical protein